LGGRLPGELLEGRSLREAARRISRANELNPDPNTSLVVATAATLGLAAVARCGVGQAVFVDMFGANAYANFDDFFDYPGKPPRVDPDAGGFGLSDGYRLYECADSWVFVSIAPRPQDQASFESFVVQFADAADASLEAAFKRRAGHEWIAALRDRGFACVRADAGLPADRIVAEGLVVSATSRDWGTYVRHAPLLSFTGAASYGGWCAMGEHTESLREEVDR